MRNLRLVIFVLFNYILNFSFGSNSNFSDTSLRLWTQIGGNTSVHFFNSTPLPYKSENLFSSGYELSAGFKNSSLSFSIGYRNHIVSFQQFNSDLDVQNGYGNYTVYDYQIQSLPLRFQLNSELKKYSLGFNFGFTINQGNFKKIVVYNSPTEGVTYSPGGSTMKSQFFNLSSGVSIEKHLNKRASIGFAVEGMYDLSHPFEYERPSQMNPPKSYLNPYNYSNLSLLGSVNLKYWLK